MFLRKGFANIHMSEIAAAAGISEGSLREHYPDMSGLLNDILGETTEWYFAVCEDAVARSRGPEAQLAALIRSTIEFHISHRDRVLLLRQQIPLVGEDFLTIGRRLTVKRASSMFAEVVRRGVASGIFTTPYPDDARRVIEAACGSVVEWYREDGEIAVDDLVERYSYLSRRLLGDADHLGPRDAAGPCTPAEPSAP
nr:TetR family transcriptional regulator [Frankia sp. CcI49]